MTEGYAVRHCYHFLLRQSEVLDHILPCRLGYGDHARGSARKARDDHAGVVAEPRPKVPGCVQHTEVVNRDDGRKAPADRSQPGGEVEQVGTRYMEIARQMNGKLYDICNLNNFGSMLDDALGSLLLPLTSFQLSAVPTDPSQISVTIDGAPTTNFRYDPVSNRIVFPQDAVPPPGSHITATFAPACN